MLFLKECKKVFKSLTFLLLAAAMALTYFTQYHNERQTIQKPQPDTGDYGTVITDDPGIIIPRAVESLYIDFVRNSYTAYPIGFYKNVKLSESKRQKMVQILSALTGYSTEQIFTDAQQADSGNDMTVGTESGGEYVVQNPQMQEQTDIPVNPSMTYDEFRNLMDRADDLIGGGSEYSQRYLAGNFGRTEKTYEQALDEYNAIVETDRYSGAYARLFCDYIGLMCSLLPMFAAVAICLRDTRKGINQLVYSRQAGSAKIIMSRFAAVTVASALVVLVLAAAAGIEVIRQYGVSNVDVTAFFKYSAMWLLPSIMFSTAVGMFITELTQTPAAILIYTLWWYADLFSVKDLSGGRFGWSLSVRHNCLGKTEIFAANFGSFLLNRASYAAAALIFAAATVFIYEIKRKGRYHGIRIPIRRHSKGKSAS